MMNGNIKGFVTDLKAMVAAIKADEVSEFVTEDGDIEDWGKISKSIIEGLDEWVEMLSEKVQ
jgi:hypothetical protein